MRTLLLAVAAFVFAVFARGVGGGDGGVWILPQSRILGGPGGGSGGHCRMLPPRDWRVVTVGKSDLVLKLPVEMGVSTAQIVECATQVALPAPVVGQAVLITPQTLNAVLVAPGPGEAEGVIVDANQRGFVIVLRRLSATDVRIDVY